MAEYNQSLYPLFYLYLPGYLILYPYSLYLIIVLLGDRYKKANSYNKTAEIGFHPIYLFIYLLAWARA